MLIKNSKNWTILFWVISLLITLFDALVVTKPWGSKGIMALTAVILNFFTIPMVLALFAEYKRKDKCEYLIPIPLYFGIGFFIRSELDISFFLNVMNAALFLSSYKLALYMSRKKITLCKLGDGGKGFCVYQAD